MVDLFQADGPIQRDPLTRKETLVILENLYDVLLRVEQMRREQPPVEDEERTLEWYVLIQLFATNPCLE